jgi:hypothetical protein
LGLTANGGGSLMTNDQSVWLQEPPAGYWDGVAVTQPPVSVTSHRVIYGDIAALLSGGLPDAPTPEVLRRNDGVGMFYSGQVNSLFGPPECGKTHISVGTVAEALTNGGKAVFIDLDHNGILSTATRLLAAGVPPETLQDLDRFRYKEPEDREDLIETVADLRAWKPDVAIIDSVGELLPMMGLNSNSPDDFTIAHTAVLKPLAMAGSCVVIIDHVAKNTESQAQGPTGTAAKARAIGGTMLRVTIKDQFAPGRGGSAYLNIKKDRHGGLRAASPTGDKEPLAGTFKMFPDSSFAVYAPTDGERAPEAAPGADLAALNALNPPPESVRDVMARLQWGNHRAALTLRVWREQIAAVTVTDMGGVVTATPSGTRNSAVTQQQATLTGAA